MLLRALRHPVTRGHRLSALYRYLAWKIQASLFKGPAVIPFINETLLLGSRLSREAEEVRLLVLFDFEVMGFIAHFLRAGELFVDVGAGMGTHAVLAAAATGAFVTAFESSPARASLLRRNAAVNQLSALIDCREAALAEASGQREVVRQCEHGLPVACRAASGPFACSRVARLDDMDLRSAPVLARIDVAGDELAVLRGAHAMLSSPSLCGLILGTDRNCPTTAARLPLVEALLERYGFVEIEYDPLKRRVVQPCAPRRKSIYVRADEMGHVVPRLERAPMVWVNGELCI